MDVQLHVGIKNIAQIVLDPFRDGFIKLNRWYTDVSLRFLAVGIVLNDDNRTELPVNWWLNLKSLLILWRGGDMIKFNETDVTYIAFELQTEISDTFLYCLGTSKNLLYLCNQVFNCVWVLIKMKHFQWMSRIYQISNMEYHHHVTHFP